MISFLIKYLKLNHPKCISCGKRLEKVIYNSFTHPKTFKTIKIEYGYISYSGFFLFKKNCCDFKTEIYRTLDCEDYYIMRYNNDLIISGSNIKTMNSYLNDFCMDYQIPMPNSVKSFKDTILKIKKILVFL